MDINLKAGEVNVIYSDYLNKVVKENMIQLTDTFAIKFELNKTKNCIEMIAMNTLLDEPEQKGEINKENFARLLKGGKDLFIQLD